MPHERRPCAFHIVVGTLLTSSFCVGRGSRNAPFRHQITESTACIAIPSSRLLFLSLSHSLLLSLPRCGPSRPQHRQKQFTFANDTSKQMCISSTFSHHMDAWAARGGAADACRPAHPPSAQLAQKSHPSVTKACTSLALFSFCLIWCSRCSLALISNYILMNERCAVAGAGVVVVG